MLLGIYMAVCYLIVKRVRCCSLVSNIPILFEDYPVHGYADCLVDSECYPYM